VAHSNPGEAPAADAGVQRAYWEGPGAARWTGGYAAVEAVFAPVAALLLERARPAPGERVVDVGCGCGGTTLELARRVAPDGHALGLDISAAMIAEARGRAGEDAVDFVVGDAATHRFAPGSIDLVFSRFGVMFFPDPVAAFANLRRGARRGARLAFACWREAKRNPWQIVSLRAACKHAPRLPELGPEDPGPFSFADPDRVRRILDAAGFAEISLTPVELELDLAAGRGFAAAIETAQRIGAAARALEGQPAAVRAAAVAEMRAALAPYRRGDSVALGAAIWIVEAVNP